MMEDKEQKVEQTPKVEKKETEKQSVEKRPVEKEEVEKEKPEEAQVKRTNTETSTTKYETFKPIQDEPKKTKRKSKTGIWISLLVLIIAIVGMCVYYYLGIYKNSQKVYQEVVADGIEALKGKTTEEFTTIKTKVKLGLNVELEDEIKELAEGYIEDILELINNTELEVELQMDKEQQQMLYKIDSTYENEDLIKMNMLIDAKEESAYMELEQFFKKVLKVDMDSVETFEMLKEVFETERATLGESVSEAQVLKILNKEVSKAIKKEYCSKESEKIDIGEKEEKVDVYILKMTGKQFVEEVKTIAENLKENKDFIKCFKDEYEIKEQLDTIIEAIEDAEVEEDGKFTIKLYKKGIKQDIVRVDFRAEADDQIVEAQITKEEDGYKVKMLANGMALLTATTKQENIDENTIKTDLTIDVKQVGKIEINIESSYVTGEKIDKLDTKNAVDVEELTEQEMMDAYEKLEESKLYELVEKYVELFTGSSLGSGLNNSNINSGINGSNSSINGNNSNISGNIVTKVNNNQIITYDNETVITFQIPTAYGEGTSGYSSETLKSFTKGNTDVTISSYFTNKDEYLKSKADSFMETYESSGYYTNVTKSEEKTIQIDGKTFYYIEISYEYFNEKYTEVFICTSVSTKNIYTVDISQTGAFNPTDIEGFLKISY